MHYYSIIHIDSLQNICSTRPVISVLVQSKLDCVLALTWFIRYICYWNLQFLRNV